MEARVERVSAPEGAEQVSSAVGAEGNAWIIGGDDEEVIVIDQAQDAAAILEAVGDRDVIAVICTHGHATCMSRRPRGRSPSGTSHRWPCTRPTGGASGARCTTRAIPRSRWTTRRHVRRRGRVPGGHPHAGALRRLGQPVLPRAGGRLHRRRAARPAGQAPHDGDFPDYARQLNSIGEYLLDLPADTRVLPGHGEETTIAAASKRFDDWVTSGPGVRDWAGGDEAIGEEDEDR